MAHASRQNFQTFAIRFPFPSVGEASYDCRVADGDGVTTRFEHLDLVTVVCKYGLIDGTPASGTVLFSPTVTLIDAAADRVIFPMPIGVDLDDSGNISVDLPATDDPDISPSGWTYQVIERIVGSQGRTFNIILPLGSGPIALATANHVAASVGDPASDGGDAGSFGLPLDGGGA